MKINPEVLSKEWLKAMFEGFVADRGNMSFPTNSKIFHPLTSYWLHVPQTVKITRQLEPWLYTNAKFRHHPVLSVLNVFHQMATHCHPVRDLAWFDSVLPQAPLSRVSVPSAPVCSGHVSSSILLCQAALKNELLKLNSYFCAIVSIRSRNARYSSHKLTFISSPFSVNVAPRFLDITRWNQVRNK